MTSLLDEARAALEVAREDPKPTLQRAAAVIETAIDDEAVATAHFAMGMAHRTLANGAESTSHLEQAAARSDVFPDLQGRILRSLAFNYAQSGKHSLADRTIGQSIDLLNGQEQNLSRLQQAFMFLMRGEHLRALPVLSTAIGAFDAPGRDEYLELTLYNRALIHTELGDYESAVTDLALAYDTGMRLGHPVSAAEAALHLSQVLGWKGDIPAAMRWHARSVELRAESGADNPLADTEHAFLLIQARLMREAEETLTSSLPRLVAAGSNEAIAVAGYLLLAEVLVARGAHSQAAAQVELARSASPDDGRYRFDIAATDHRTRVAGGDLTPELLDSIIATADEMEANGERHAAAVERLRGLTVALELGEIPLASQIGETAAAVAASGPLWLQIQSWTGQAELRFSKGDTRGAAAAVRAGFNRLDEYRAGIGATDLRIHAADYGQRLAAIGLELAIRARSIARIYNWAERLRTTSQHTSAITPSDPELQSALSQLRQLTSRARSAADQPGRFERQLREQERLVRNLARQATGTNASSRPASLAAIRRQLQDRVLVEFVEIAGQMYAIVATSERTRLVDLGPSLDVANIVDQLRFAAERIARPSTSDASRTAALSSVAEASERIRCALLEPIGSLLETHRPVIVPTAGLHGIPWGHVITGPVEIAPSATSWLGCTRLSPAAANPVVVAGPGLEHAKAETETIGTITGAETVSAGALALELMPNARLAHFACHARPRLDTPMFSSLVLDDGEITLYDIEQLQGVPGTVVLAACDGGTAVIASGDEILGLAGAFLSLGSRSVVAPLFTVSDSATAAAMTRFHKLLASGSDPAAALAAIRNSDDAVVAFTARSFSCFGAA